MPTPLILASSSSYRQALLGKLGLPFSSRSPDIDETPLANESAADLVKRLAHAKAAAVASHYDQGWVIGSDQAAALGTQILGKPLTHAKALEQLQACRGRAVTFYTGLCLYNAASAENHASVETFTVHFRHLSDAQLDYYLQQEQPYDCAGSFKSEGMGIALFEKLEGDDPNTLIGLPLIRLCDLLERAGFKVLAPRA